jgi:hypothetical protein
MDMADEDTEAASEPTHVEALAASKPKKFIDYAAFGRLLSDHMSSKGMMDRDVAKRVDLGRELFTYERRINAAASGKKTDPETVKAIADGLGLEVPYMDKAAETAPRSPFGSGRKKGGGGRVRGGGGEEE